MQLKDFTDYSLRVLIYLGLKGDQATVAEMATAFRISRHHLVKVVHQLSSRNYLVSFKGASGGVRLARDPKEIRIGDFVRETETNMRLVECFDEATNTCPIIGVCKMELILRDANASFLETLNRHTLADLLVPSRTRDERRRKLGLA